MFEHVYESMRMEGNLDLFIFHKAKQQQQKKRIMKNATKNFRFVFLNMFKTYKAELFWNYFVAFFIILLFLLLFRFIKNK